ncbi:hypothetical protein MBEBAB_0863 [Brevundimonas abyssalis TAR-001]|uniref:Uncharacterized protein n=1 Tax=Brevundimonas abyssalis TAR-001 TaxID=1391729 RepID=A0A8E0KI44_9CAUL|nr:hypothetical protein MBEBAB_0863 [Brevundimonas abyssalis TAR-001]
MTVQSPSGVGAAVGERRVVMQAPFNAAHGGPMGVDCVSARVSAGAAVEGVADVRLVVGPMVAVDLFQRARGHTQVLGSAPQRYVSLHQPSCRRMPVPVRCDVGGKASVDNDSAVALADSAPDRPTTVVQNGFDRREAGLGTLDVQRIILSAPTHHVPQQTLRNTAHGATLCGLVGLAPAAPKDPALVQVDPGAVIRWLPAKLRKNAGASARVHPQQHETHEVSTVGASRRHRGLPASRLQPPTPGGSQNCRDLLTAECVTRTDRGSRIGEDRLAGEAVLPVPVRCGRRKVLELATRPRRTDLARLGGVLVRLHRLRRTMDHIGLAGAALDVAERLAAPPVQHGRQAGAGRSRISKKGSLLARIKSDDLVDEHLFGLERAILGSARSGSLGQVLREYGFSLCKAVRAATCADVLVAVPDKVDGRKRSAGLGVNPASAEVEPSALSRPTHCLSSNSERTAAGVTNHCPATFFARRFPLRISVRKDERVSGPPGKKTATASRSVRGSSSPQSLGEGRSRTRDKVWPRWTGSPFSG